MSMAVFLQAVNGAWTAYAAYFTRINRSFMITSVLVYQNLVLAQFICREPVNVSVEESVGLG